MIRTDIQQVTRAQQALEISSNILTPSGGVVLTRDGLNVLR